MQSSRTTKTTGQATPSAGFEPDLSGARILAVCEHFSFRPLISFECLDFSEMSEPGGFFDRHFAQYVPARPFEDNHRDESFDLIICNDSYQYFQDFEALTDEIYRLLKTGGFCYFAGRTRGSKEPSDQNGAARYFRSKRVLAKKLNDFWIHDYMPLIKENPAAFKRENLLESALKGNMSGVIRKILTPFEDEFVWVLTKKK